MIMLNSVKLNYFYFLAFYVEKTGSSECPLICTMRCELGDQNDPYYLCADKDGKLFLSVSIEQHFVSVSAIGPHTWGWKPPQVSCLYLSWLTTLDIRLLGVSLLLYF